MKSRAISWLVEQYRCVLGRMRLAEHRHANPLLYAHATGGGSSGAVKPRGRLRLEPLEQRTMLTIAQGLPDPLVLGTAGADALTVRHDGENIHVLLGTDTVLGSFEAAQVQTLTVDGLGGDDVITIELADDVDTSAAAKLRVVGGDGDGDTLAGPARTTTWIIDGPGSGMVANAAFGGFENLKGAAGNEDTFVFEAAGSVRGVLEGGDGGFDVIELANGFFHTVEYTVGGPDSGTIARDGDLITYAGFEPIIDATGGDKVINGTAGADQIRLRDHDSSNSFVVSLHPGEDVRFTDALEIDSLTINALGGDDDIGVESLVSIALADVTIDAGAGNDTVELGISVVESEDSLSLIGGTGAYDELFLRTREPLTLSDAAVNAIDLSGIERAYISGTGNGASQNVSSFSGQIFSFVDVPNWVEEGPNAYTIILDGATAPYDPSSGAINAIVVDPTDRHTVYLGTVNGGIWRNTGSKEVFFETAEATLTSDDHVTLNAFAEYLEANPHITVEIAGHTDSQGTAADNLTLSQNRANAVRNYLVNIRRIDAGRLRAVGYGEDRPVADNLGGDQPLNRRVELLVQNWEPLTDRMPSLSVSSIAISPLSNEVIYAGVGRTSSFGGAGGFETGLLFSGDGGETWRVLGAERLTGLAVTQVLPTTLTTASGAQVVFVSTFDVDRDNDSTLDDRGGVFRLEVRADGTAEKIEKVSEAGAANGLPAGHYTDLAMDPGSATRPVRIYAASPTAGIHQFTDGGDGLWHAVNTGFTFNADSDVDGNDDLLQRASRIRLALHAPTGTVYGAVLGPVANGLFSLASNRVGLVGLFKSEDFAASWTAMPLPSTTDNGTVYGLHASGQGDMHFSLAVDPLDEDVVYVGGDAQGDTTNNAAGVTDAGAGRLFVFNDDPLNPAWVQIVGNNAAGTATHADSRGIVFTSPFTMLQIDDGGLARLQNPAGHVEQGTRRWTSMNHGLRISEVLRLAYDPLNNDILIGSQDNGSAHQGAGSTDGLDNNGDGTTDEADESAFWSGTGGDGNSQATIPIDTNGDTIPDRVLRYSLHNNFQFLQAYEFTNAGVMVNAAGNPANTFVSIDMRTGPGAAAQSGINAQDQALTFDVVAMVVNANDPTRMLIAYFGIYESINTNINPAAGQTRVLPLEEVRQIDPAPGTNVPQGSEVTALVYGGTIGATRHDDLVIAARGSNLLIRQTAAGAFTTRAVTGAGTIRDIAVNPANWRVVYVADASDVYRIDDITDANEAWVKITGNLKAVGQQDLRTLEYVSDSAPQTDVLLVGGIGGVSRLFSPGSATAAAGGARWTRFGTGLPNAPVFDVEYIDRVGPGSINGGDKLIAGTLGRGVWSIQGADLLSLEQNSVLQIYGAQTDDQLMLVRDPANPTRFSVFDLAQSATDRVLVARGAELHQVQIDTRGGNDTLTVDHGNGAVAVPRGIAFDGGADANSLVLQGGAVTSYTTGTTSSGLPFHDIVDLKNRTQRVLFESATVDASALPSPLTDAFATVKGAIHSLVDFLTLSDELSRQFPLFGTSLGRALNGVELEEPAPTGPKRQRPAFRQGEVVAESSRSALNLLRRFIETGTGAFSIDDIAGFTSLADLASALEGLDESGTGTVGVTGDLATGFEITFNGVRKTLTGRADVALDLFGGKIDVDGQVDVSADVTLNLVFGVDNTRGFYIKSNDGTDVVIDKVRVAAADDVAAGGRFGFLGVELTEVVLTTAEQTRFDINIAEAGGGDDFITLPELLGDPGDYLSVTPVAASGAGVYDVELTGKFEVSALLPGQSAPFTLVDARGVIKWDNINAAELNGPDNVSIGAAVSSPAADALLAFLDVTGTEVLDGLKTLRGHLETLGSATDLPIDIPMLQQGLSKVIDVVEAVNQRIVDPLTGFDGSSAGFGTIQQLAVQLANGLGIDPAALGLSYNAGVLTYDVDLQHTFTSAGGNIDLGFALPAGLDVQALANASFSAGLDLDFTLGIDVGGIAAGGEGVDNIFIKDVILGASLDLTLIDLDASARFGFASINITNGTGSTTDAALQLTLKDPGTNTAAASAGRIDLSELDDVLANTADLVSGSVSGAASLTLPVSVPFLVPLGLGSGTVTVTIPDFANPSTATVDFPGLPELGNFGNIDAASLVGLLGQLTFWMDEFRRSEEFANFDIPLVGPALDKVLGFADAFRDRLLIDDADNGLDDTKTLLSDLNAALDAAGLGDRIRAENSGGKIKLISNDPSIHQFHVSAASGLGFGAQSSGEAGVFESIVATGAAPTDGVLTGDVTFTITIESGSPPVSGTPIEVTIEQADTADNTAIGDDRWKLVNAQNAPTFTTVDGFVQKLTEVLSVPNLVYNPADDTLTFSLSLSEVFGQTDLPLGFAVSELDDFLKIQTNGLLRLAADGELNLTLGVFLGQAEASTKIGPGGIESLAQLNGGDGVDISTAERITGPGAVRTVYGQLSGDATFTLTVTGDAALPDPIVIKVLKFDTTGNTTAADLAADITNKLNAAGLTDKIAAVAVGQRIELVKLTGAVLTAFSMTAATSDPAVKDIGFAASKAAEVDAVDAKLKLQATKDLPALRGRLTGDASFTLNLSGGKTLAVSVAAADTATNRSALDIVSDINASFDRATDPDWFYQSGTDGEGDPIFSPLIEVGFSDGRLTFTTRGGATGFSISGLGGTAAAELGLEAAVGDKTDLIITVRDGTIHRITLDGATTIADVIARIADQTGGTGGVGGDVTVSINERRTGLNLADNTTGTAAAFKVQVANGSRAALDLGIVREDAAEGETADGKIEGTDIAGLTPLDRFFIQATPEGQDPLASVGIDISTPTPVTASAEFGFVGLGLSGGGALPGGKALAADLVLRLNEPSGSTDGRISLAELINGLEDLGSLFDISLTGAGQIDLNVQADAELTNLGIDVSEDARISVAVNLGDVFAETPVDPTVTFTYPDFGELLDFGNLDFDFQSFIAGLRQLTDFLGDFEAFGFLSQPLPVVNVSVSDLVSIADKFATAIDDAQANPAGTLQVLENKLKQAFGLPASSEMVNLVLVNDTNGTSETTTDDFKILKVEINLDASFSDTLGVDLDLGLPIDLGGNADLAASGSLRLDLDVGFRVDDPTEIYLFESTGLSGTLDLDGTNLAFRAAVGPLGVFVNGGSVDIHGSLVDPLMPNKLFSAGFQQANFPNDRIEIGAVQLSNLHFDVGAAVDVTLPVYFPTDSVHAGNVLFNAAVSLEDGELEFTADPRAETPDHQPIGLDQLFAFNPADLSLLDQLLLGVDGIDLFLEGLQDVADGEIGGFTLPLIGDKLAGAVDVIGDFRSNFVGPFRSAIEGLSNPGAAFAAAGYAGGMSGAATEPDPVSKILFRLLGPTGLGILADTNNSGAQDVFDIQFRTNINQSGVAPKDVYFDWDFKLGDTLVDVGAGIGFDIGIPGLGLKTSGEVNLNVNWELALGFGLNYADGFYLDIADDAELELNVDVTVPGLGITGTLGFLQITAVEDVDPSEPDSVTHLGATFGIDINNRGDTPEEKDAKLGFTELGRIGVDAKIGADAVADLAMKLSLASELVPDAAANFPSIVADFLLDWRIGDRAAGELVSLGALNGSFLKDGLQFVGFSHVGLDLGTYFTNLIGPIVEKVQEITEPIKPFLDFLTEPIPVISDLAGPTSLLDIAAQSGAVNPGIIKAIEVVDQVIDIANGINIPSGANAILYFDAWLPSLVIFDASENDALAPGDALLDLTNPNLDLKKLSGDLLGGLGKFLPDQIQDALGDVATDLAAGLTKMLPGGPASGGFRLPIIDEPSQIFGMLMGQQATLVEFTLDALEVNADFSAFFSIFGPLGVSINAEFGAKFGPVTFGYDTYGITQFAAGDFRNPLLLFDGLYVSDIDGAGVDVAELQFDAGLWAAAELNLGIARGGVGGGLFAAVDFDLHDPDDDGKVRIKELVTNVVNELRHGEPALAPLAIFNIDGQLTAELFAFLKINLGFFKLNKKFLITEPLVLLDFESDFERFPTLATELPGGALQLNMGKFADRRVEGDRTDGDEHFHVKQGSDADHVLVWAPSLGVDESEAQEYKVTKLILAMGGEGDDVIDLSGVTSDLKYQIEGNAGNDRITAGTGTGNARILGGVGDDTITGGGGKDTIFGEAGDDSIHGGDDTDWLFGDGDPKGAITKRAITAAVKANDGADSLYGDDGDDVLLGAGGADLLEGGADADLLIGDGAKISLNATKVPTDVVDTDRGALGGADFLQGDGGNDSIYAGLGNDVLSGGADHDLLRGESGLDLIDGGDGDDEIYGGSENDGITAGDGADSVYGESGNDLIEAGGDADYVEGGTGLDTIRGDAGEDRLYGNADPDEIYGGDDADYIEGGHGNDLTLGEAGNDLLVGGYGSDTIDGGEGSDAYKISARGGVTTELTTAYDSGTGIGDADTMTLVGTTNADTVLLRAMADFYFPTLTKLTGDASSDGLTDRIFASGEPDKLAALLQAIEDAYGPHEIPTGLVGEMIDLFTDAVRSGVLAALAAEYDAPSGTSSVPPIEVLEGLVEDILDSASRGKLAEIQKAIAEAYGSNPVPAGMFDAITNAFQPPASLKAAIEGEVAARYESELDVLGSDTDTGFVALISNGGGNLERFNYRQIESLVINTLQGDDYVVSDDVIAPTTVNLGGGQDGMQVGQVFRSERVKDPAGELITGITAEDVFTTLEITRGWLSNGISRPMTVNGGDDNDEFTVFHNVAILNLNGGDGDDLFTVRAFALKGSTDSERGRTDMKGDGGADTVLYVVNAPVGIDGGDGFDTIRVVGTEFADDFVVTDEGVFGAGLNVSYVNIEKLVADGAEGDDRYFVLSTGLGVITEIDGGLGSDTFFVGGNSSRAPIPVISNDLKGHNGVILHGVESVDPAWDGLRVEGISANVGDDEQDFILVTESGGSSRVTEGATTGGSGWAFDGYGVRLTRRPGVGQTVVLNVVLAGMSPEDKARGFQDLEFFAVNGSDTLDGAPNGAPLGYDPLTDLPILPFLVFDETNWDQPQYVKFRAANTPAGGTPDTASEGRRFTFINHTGQNSTDPDYRAAQLLSVKVQMDDDDRDGVIVTPSGRGNTVLEDGFTDSFDVVLAKKPTSDVMVTMNVLNGQVTLSELTLTFTPDDWDTAQTVTLTGTSDTVVEGFHTDYIDFTVTSADAAQVIALPDFIHVDGDFDLLGVQDVPAEKPTSYVLLPHRPVSGTLAVKVGGVTLDPTRFSLSGNTVTFLTAEGTPQFVTGKVEAKYSYGEAGYDATEVRDAVVDVYDQDAPTVIIEQTGGSTDVIEGSATGTDTYRVRLSRAPSEDVVVSAEAVKTRSTYGRTAHFQTQVYVNGTLSTSLTFTDGNWDQWQTVTVSAIDDGFLDGNDTQVFAPDLQTVNKIRGPLIIEGAAGAGSLSLPDPLMLPSELNVLEPDGHVVAFSPESGGGATETMFVNKSDLDAVIAQLQADDSTITALADLVGKTLEMSSGAGTDVVLDPTRPDDRFDRFWLITGIEVITDGDGDATNDKVRLTLQNPTQVDPEQPNVTAPNADSEYAITSLSINFFADEREQVDYLFVFDEDSVADDKGALTSSDGVVLAFDAASSTMTVDTASLQAVAKLLGVSTVEDLANRTLDITVGPGLGGRWNIAAVTDGAPGTKLLQLTLVSPASGDVTPTNRSEFRIEGADSKGRITGFGMGPNVLFSGRPQPGGITYGDIEVVQVNLGSGNDDVRVDYTTNAEDHTTERSGDFHTLTMLNTGGGNDAVTVNLADGQDGALSLNAQDGNDTVNAAASTLGLTIFGWDGDDSITGGAGQDTIFGDRGRVDSVNADGTIVTRLGHTVPSNPVNPPVTGATATTLTDATATFATDYGGLAGLVVQVISSLGRVQYRTIVSNTATELTVSEPWEATPDATYFYRIATLPEDQTDGTVRGPSVILSIDNEIGGDDLIIGGDADDVIIAGAGNDTVSAGAGHDKVAGDDARFDFAPVSGDDGPTKLVRILDPETDGDDAISGDAGDDLLIGGLGDDAIDGNDGNDVAVGDAAEITYAADGVTIDRVETIDRANGGDDRIDGGAGDDVVLGGTGHDDLDGGADRDLVLGDNALLVRNPGSADAVAPRYRTLTGQTIYDDNGLPKVADDPSLAIPGNLPAWADWTITLDQTDSNFGNDSMAGGAGDDHLFGQLGDDTIQGDGSITLSASADAPSVEDFAGAGTDGDDYIEGNGGNDVIFGNLGQDDLIGGSSNLFSYADPARRLDGADVIFGGAGTDGARNDAGDANIDGTGHARDADVILGDNGNIFRLVDGLGAHRSFTYDDYAPLRLIPRAVLHLDYVYGGGNLPADAGAADTLHGESGDDSVYGTVGDDVLFGGGQDDDLHGGIGNDRIYGGTGEDGVIGDDGIVLTSRNGSTETLHGVTEANAEENIALPGPFTGAWIYISGRLNKAAHLFAWEQGGNDVIYGGLGDDFLHAGAGDDAVSGAEAQAAFYNGAPITNTNPLGYDPVTRKLAAYDAANPLVRIGDFFLNFDATDSGGTKIEDGKDRLFGDLGHDWLVGGTGNDRLFGGAGDDLHNADDDHTSQNGLNDAPDTPAYADRDFVYGGDGLDVLIGNTGGDRMFDWSGEFNTFVVPFSPFGSAAVNRLIAPHVPEFLLALGKESGADQTRTEPDGELGLFRQQDPQWATNHGAPRDPQPGNGGARRDTQGAPEDDRAPSTSVTSSAGGASIQNANDATVGNVQLAADPSDPTRNALFVGGSNSSDVIDVRRGSTASSIRVIINNVDQGEFDAANVSRIIVYGNAGNDSVTINADLGNVTSVIYGGDGNDTLSGGAGNNLIDGEDGDDRLIGSPGRDLLFGGRGADVLEGNRGDDVLVGGSYLASGDLYAAGAFITAWSLSTASYDQRIAALSSGVTAGGALPLSGIYPTLLYRLDAPSVLDDGAVDILNGVLGQDWFIASATDSTDDKGNETTTVTA